MRHAALGTQTLLPRPEEYLIAALLSVSMLLIGFIAFNRIEKEARARGSIATS
jgi:hypothetical protein